MSKASHIHHRPATPDEFPGFFNLMMDQTGKYLKDSLRALTVTVEQFEIYFRSVGQVWAIERDRQVVGFYWVELRGEVLHIHALVLRTEFQQQGIGPAVIGLIEQCRPAGVTHIEAGVHRSNVSAQALCKGCGFVVTRELPEVDVVVYRKSFTQ